MREKLHRALIIAAMVTPPFNILVWAIAYIVYLYSGGSKKDHNGGTALALFFAPALIAGWVWGKIFDRR